MGGSTNREGRVEVCVDGRWGTMCGEGWTQEQAGRVCSLLGFPMNGMRKATNYTLHKIFLA